MTFRDFVTKAALLPATVFSGLTNLVLGSYQRKEDGSIITKRTVDGTTEVTNRGLLGTVLDGVKYVGRAVSNFVHNHKTAIAIAFWASLLLAGGAALTVFLWPAALAAVTTFTIAGLSIAAVVGTSTIAQIGAVAALTAVATSLAVYAASTVVNGLGACATFFASRRSTPRPANDSFIDEQGIPNGYETMSGFGAPQGGVATAFTQATNAPANTGTLFPKLSTPVNSESSESSEEHLVAAEATPK
ncbi:hypothetical protein TUM19329_34070 [Legionella antarctica]|uniref:Transmembrane protein n=1 Tax=Legionella antarctica TaxID=2708020 RepID=A0A6F8TAN9_9GAMM|nr:hypothetical protein [Legionella antarctica]BCA97046.1 hypothetical protein TUM19329_34070 [Legionella antarctica]